MILVGAAGFEPATPGSQSEDAKSLSYASTVRKFNMFNILSNPFIWSQWSKMWTMWTLVDKFCPISVPKMQNYNFLIPATH